METKRLVLVVDMLNGFSKFGPLASNNVTKIIPVIKDIVESSDNNIFICDSHSVNDLEMKNYPVHCLTNSPEAEVVEELAPYATEKILKNTTNAFWELDHKLLLKYNQIELVGCCTDICVLQLALSLSTFLQKINADVKLIVYEDATATFDAPNHDSKTYHQFALNLMKNAGIKVRKWTE
ncbi:cysteine hydrolase family protein [Mycoplasma corogypsi]|uniref:cysteine hydrolase family protein n=1 Tax=Mycoplasma corogypsi TaxID=2106 RepID=UPI0038730DF2